MVKKVLMFISEQCVRSRAMTTGGWNDLQARWQRIATTASPTTTAGSDVTGTQIGLYFPSAKIGQGNYFYVFSGGACCTSNLWNPTGINYFGLSAVTSILNSNYGYLASTPGLTVQQAFSIDRKIDDGYPQTGSVTAQYSRSNEQVSPYWVGTQDTSATPGSSTTCYDNGGSSGATQQYSVEISNGSNVNCALSFRFQ